jgi:hypothetical protein
MSPLFEPGPLGNSRVAVPEFPIHFEFDDIVWTLFLSYPISVPLEMVLPIQTIGIQRPVPHRVDVPDDTQNIHEDDT